MSAIQMAPNASGTGTLSIASPNTNSNRTITLPDATTTLFGTADNASASDVKGVYTTATVTSGTTAMTVGSATSLVAGMVVVAQGITPGTTISSIVGTAVTLSANANATLSAAPVTFYSVTKVITPGSVGGQTCRAWVNFNGTVATPSTIRSSYNVTSITKAGTGSYTVNFTNALSDANYSYYFSGGGAVSSGTMVYQGGTQTTSALSYTLASTSATQDASTQCVLIFGN